MKRLFVSALSLASLSSACGSEVEIGSGRLAITGGAEEDGYLAVFSLAYDGVGGCTGTCIAPRIALTAAHCLWDETPENLSALFGDDEQVPVDVIKVRDFAVPDDDGDIAVLALAGDCPATIPANRTALEDHVGEPVVVVGFGVTGEESEDFGIKRSGVATLFSVDPAEVPGLYPGELATGNDPGGTCYGDSGGPTFMTLEGTQVVVGTTSRGSLDENGRDYPCGEGQSIAVRVDSYTAFIDDFIAAHPSPDPVGPDDGGESPDPGGDPDPGAGDLPDEVDDPSDTLPEPEPEPEPAAERRHSSGCGVAGPGAQRWPAVLLVLAPLAARRRRRIR